MIRNYWSQKHVADRLTWIAEEYGIEVETISEATQVRHATLRLGGAQGRSWRLEYGCPLRRVCCQADGLAYASMMGWMRVEPQQRNAHPTRDQNGSMNPRDFSRGESQESMVDEPDEKAWVGVGFGTPIVVFSAVYALEKPIGMLWVCLR